MKDVDYKDGDGRWFRVRVPDDCPEDRYSEGVPVGPPDLDAPLEELGLRPQLRVVLHNQLHGRRIFTRRDVLMRPHDVLGAIQATYKLDMQRLQTMFLQEGG